MEGSVEDLGAPPDSWEVADLEASVSRLMLSSSSNPPSSSSSSSSSNSVSHELADASASVSSSSAVASQLIGGVSEDVISSVDQFLREALQNPRERLSVLRMEQDVEKFIRDPTQQQMEFQQLPTSYLRLAAHRVAQKNSSSSAMERSKKIISGKVWGVIVLVGLISVMAQQAKALGLGGREAYGCWGGCYNECILQSGMANSERLPCYLNCLGSCISLPLSVSASSDKTGYQYYCQLGCSMDQCIRFSSDEGKMEGCLENCSTKICNIKNV